MFFMELNLTKLFDEYMLIFTMFIKFYNVISCSDNFLKKAEKFQPFFFLCVAFFNRIG